MRLTAVSLALAGLVAATDARALREYVFELNVMPPTGAAETAFGVSAYVLDYSNGWGAYGTYISTPPETLTLDGLIEIIAVFDDDARGQASARGESGPVEWRLFDYDRRYVDQTVLNLGATYELSANLHAFAGIGWAWEQPMVRGARRSSSHRREGGDRGAQFNPNVGLLIGFSEVTLSVGYQSALEQLSLGIGRSF
ncbi:MAG: hypothetical protein AAFQ36_08170 [Pseudomonadota bacterium]